MNWFVNLIPCMVEIWKEYSILWCINLNAKSKDSFSMKSFYNNSVWIQFPCFPCNYCAIAREKMIGCENIKMHERNTLLPVEKHKKAFTFATECAFCELQVQFSSSVWKMSYHTRHDRFRVLRIHHMNLLGACGWWLYTNG